MMILQEIERSIHKYLQEMGYSVRPKKGFVILTHEEFVKLRKELDCFVSPDKILIDPKEGEEISFFGIQMRIIRTTDVEKLEVILK